MTRAPALALLSFLFACIACSGEHSGTPTTPDGGGDAGGAGDGAVSQNCTPPAQPSNSPWRFVRPSVPTFSWTTIADPGGRSFFIVDGAGNWRRLLRTDDDGRTWCQIATPVTPEGVFLQGRFLHVAGTSLAAGGPSAVYRSLDRGRTWEALPATLPGVPRRLFALDDDGRQLVAIVPRAGPTSDGPALWESLDGGGTWKALSINLAAVGSLVADWEMIARDAANPSRWIARASVGINAFGGPGGTWNLIESLDDGITWRTVEFPGGPTHTDGFLTSGLVEIVTTADGALWRRQPGQAWQPFGTIAALRNPVVLGAFDQVVYARGESAELRRNQTVRRNESAGNWAPISPPDRDEQAIPLAPGRVMATGARGLRLSDDDGLAWRRMGHFATGQLMAARAPGSRRLYLARFFALSHSDDGGQTWSDHPLTDQSFIDVSPDPVEAAVVHAALNTPNPAAGTSTTKLHRSGDGGMTWTPVPVKLAGMEAQQVRVVLAMATSPPALLVTTELGLLRSEDGGATWTNVLGPVASRLSGSSADPNTVLAVSFNFSYVSVNGGRAWAEAPLSFFEAQFHPTNPDLLYIMNAGFQGWRLSRYSLAQGTVSELHTFRGEGVQATRTPLSDRLLVVTPDSRILLRDSLGKLWESPDDGVTWIEPGDRGSTFIRSILLDPAAPNSLMAIADGGLLRLPLP